MTTVLSIEQLKSRLKRGSFILWPYRGNVEEGEVLFVNHDSVEVIWLEGYKSRNDTVPLVEVLSLHDKQAPEVALSPFSGKGWLTAAGLKWQHEHAPQD